MTELPMDHWAQRREICLTLEEGPGGLSPIGSFIVLLSASGGGDTTAIKTNFGL